MSVVTFSQKHLCTYSAPVRHHAIAAAAVVEHRKRRKIQYAIKYIGLCFYLFFFLSLRVRDFIERTRRKIMKMEKYFLVGEAFNKGGSKLFNGLIN